MLDIPGLLAHARDLHTLIFTDTITVERRTGNTTTDPLGTEVDQWAPTHTTPTIAGLVQVDRVGDQPRDNTGQPITAIPYITKTAVDVDVRARDRITVITSLDPRNVGVVVVVDADETQGIATARRLRCTRVT